MKEIKLLVCIAFILLAGMAFTSCSKMDDTYKQFLDFGQGKYPGRPVAATVYPGYERMYLVLENSADPKVKKAKIYWNNRSDSLDVTIDPTQKQTVVPFVNFPEGTYVFEIYTFDTDGNRSVRLEAIGRVYGDYYQSTLLSRPIYDATVVNDSLQLWWGNLSDTTIIGTEIIYTDLNGQTHNQFVDKSYLLSQFPNFPRGTIEYRTVYLPGVNAIDTFYTDWVSRYVKGQRFPLSNAGWTATASTYDNRNGRVDRLPEKAIDGNIGTEWVNLVNGSRYPHTLTINMGKVEPSVEGLTFYLRAVKEAPKRITVMVSADSTSWANMGVYNLEYVTGYQNIDFPEAQAIKYFQIIAQEPALAGEPNIILPEVGAFSR